MQTVVVNDTKIFIDLLSIDFVDAFFSLPLEVHTNDFIINVLKISWQKERVLSFASKKLYVKRYDAEEVVKIVQFQQTCENNLSFQDCSVWLYAHEHGYRLLTGDGKLRKSASESGTVVSGIFYIFDLLVETGVLLPHEACKKLIELSTINVRLPRIEIKNRVLKWGVV